MSNCSCEEKLRNMEREIDSYCLPKSEIINRCDLLQMQRSDPWVLPAVIKSLWVSVIFHQVHVQEQLRNWSLVVYSSGHLTDQDFSLFSSPFGTDLGVKSKAEQNSGRIPSSGVQSKELIKPHRSEGDLWSFLTSKAKF